MVCDAIGSLAWIWSSASMSSFAGSLARGLIFQELKNLTQSVAPPRNGMHMICRLRA